MKKTFLLTLALLISVTIFAQKKGTLLSESFDSEEMPDGWKITGGQSQNWSVSQSKLSGGEAYEMKMNYSPIFYDKFTRLTLPTLDLTGIDSVLVSFKHYVDIYTTYSSTIGIATSSSNGMNWSICYEETFWTDGQHTINKIIANDDMGKENVMICLFFRGNSANINAIYFDDIEVMTIEENNAKLVSIDIPDNIGSGDSDIIFSVQNLGVENITSFDAEYNINGETYRQTFSTDIASHETKQFIFNQGKYFIPGKYDISVSITSVNEEEDADESNNSAAKEVNVAIGSTQRIPMIEHFSSSNCGPCVSVNSYMHSITNANPGKYTYTKYAVASPPDPYSTDEVYVRQNYYYVSSVPNVILDGVNLGSTAISQYQLDANYSNTAFVNIKGAFDIEGTNVKVKADIMSYINLKDAKVFVSVNEKTTTGNVGENGETEFHHIMMKMLDDVNGNDINTKQGDYQHLEFTYDMSSTYVEEMSDLEVAVWIQDPISAEVFNSSYLYEYTEHPYPVRNLVMTEDGNDILVTWDAPEKGEPTGYNVYVNNELILNNTKDLSHTITNAEDHYTVEVFALYNEKISVGVIATTFTFEEPGDNVISFKENSFSIYPNPAKDEIYISSNERIEEVTVYNINGQRSTVNSQQTSSTDVSINVTNLNTGVYFIKINTNKENIVKRFIKY